MNHEQDAPQVPKAHKDGYVSTIVYAAVGLIILVLVAAAFLTGDGGRPQQGDPAPDFALELLDGSHISLSDLRSQVVVLNFWASWCGPCRREAPALQQVWETYEAKGVVFLGVSYRDAKGASQDFIDAFGITYRNGFDARGQISRAYGVTAVPETFVIDRQGRIVWSHIGEIEAETLVQQLEQLEGM